MKILIVDDSKMMCLKMQGFLSSIKKEAQFFVHQSAEDAENTLELNDLDFASLDLNLPGKDGLYLAEQIRNKSTDTIIALVTANRQDAVQTRAKALDCHVIHKPADMVEVEEFISKLNALLK